jgi:hypothetical protein
MPSLANQQVFENVISIIELFVKDTTDFPTAKLAFGSGPVCLSYGADLTRSPDFESFPADLDLLSSTHSSRLRLLHADTLSPSAGITHNTWLQRKRRTSSSTAEAAGLQRTIYPRQAKNTLPGCGM